MRQVVQAAGLACGRSGYDFTMVGTSTDLGGFELHDAILQFVGTNRLPPRDERWAALGGVRGPGIATGRPCGLPTQATH